jgi:hypothetical protein
MKKQTEATLKGEILEIIPHVGEQATQYGPLAIVSIGAERLTIQLPPTPRTTWQVGHSVAIPAEVMIPSASSMLSAMDQEFDRFGSVTKNGTVRSFSPNEDCDPLRSWLLVKCFEAMKQADAIRWPRNIVPFHRSLPAGLSPEITFDLSAHIHAYYIQFGFYDLNSLAQLAAATYKARRGTTESNKLRAKENQPQVRDRRSRAQSFLKRKREEGTNLSKLSLFRYYQREENAEGNKPYAKSAFYKAIEEMD